MTFPTLSHPCSLDSMTVGREPYNIKSEPETPRSPDEDYDEGVDDHYESCDEDDGLTHGTYVIENPEKAGELLERQYSIPFIGVPVDMSIAAKTHDHIAKDKR